MKQNLKKIYNYVVGGIVLLKLIFAVWVPITSDEAYYVLWGKYIDYGYYDHFPMAGWISGLMVKLGYSTLIVRLPVIILTTITGLLIYRLIKEFDEEKAILISLIYFLWPFNLLSFLHDPTVPLMFFMFVSVYTLYFAEKKESYGLYFLSGLFLSAAFLSKYFSIFIAFSYFAYFLVSKKSLKRLKGFIALALGVIPGCLVILAWNYNHEWVNLNFVLNSRDSSSGISIGNTLNFLLMQLYLITPPVLYYLAKNKFKTLKRSFDNNLKLFALTFFIPFLCFTLFSLKVEIGLHWQLGFYPLLHILLFNLLSKKEMIGTLKFIAGFSLIHVLLIVIVLLLPINTFKNSPFYQIIVVSTRQAKIKENFEIYKDDFNFMAHNYTQAAVLGFVMPEKDFGVFGKGKKYGRMYDLAIDFEELSDENILVFREKKPKLEAYKPYFDKVEVKEFEVEKAKFYLVLGYNLKYDKYRNEILKKVYDEYYDFGATKLLPYNKEFRKRFVNE